MLKDKSSNAIVATDDLDRARDFYENTLGLEVVGEDMDGVLSFRTGATTLVVYRSEGFRPGTGNAVAWGAGGEVETIAADLRAKGVTLEEYPELQMPIEDGVHQGGGDLRVIWFKDPAGNILHINSM